MKEVIVQKAPWGEVWETLLVKDELVGLKRSEHIRGRNRYSGKTYSRFQVQSNIFYSWRQGRLRVYSKGKRGIRDATSRYIFPHMSWRRREEEDLLDQGFRMLRNRNVQDTLDQEYPLRRTIAPSVGITPALAQPNIQEFTRKLFGASRYRKDLVRSIGTLATETHPGYASCTLSVAKSLNGLVPIDWIVSWITPDMKGKFSTPLNPYVARRMFKTADQKQLRRLLRGDPEYVNWLPDTADAFNQMQRAGADPRLSDMQFTDFRTLHDVLTRDARRWQQPKADIKYTGKAKKLAGSYGDISIVSPEDTHALTDWSNEMNNCISGYGYKAAQGQTLLYAVMKDDKMVANMELAPRGGDIRQLLGKNNGSVPQDVSESVKDAVRLQWPNAKTEGGWQ